jgi:hypothetical protein
MVTSAQTKVMLKPLLARRPDLAFVRGHLFLQPVTHYLRYVILNTKLSKRFYPTCGVLQLFDRNDFLHISVSKKYLHPTRTSWHQEDQGHAALLIDYIEHKMLPLIEPIIDPEHHSIFGREHWDRRNKWCDLPPGDLARDYCSAGLYDAAQALLERMITEQNHSEFSAKAHNPPAGLIRFGEPLPRGAKDHPLFYWRDAYLLELLRTDRSSIIPLLHEWEEHSVRAMKLEKYWHRTPFPAESVSSF